MVLTPKGNLYLYQVDKSKINDKLAALHRIWGTHLVFQSSFWIFAGALGKPMATAAASSNLVWAALISCYAVTTAGPIGQPTAILWIWVAVSTLLAAILHSGGIFGFGTGPILQLWAGILAFQAFAAAFFPSTILDAYGMAHPDRNCRPADMCLGANYVQSTVIDKHTIFQHLPTQPVEERGRARWARGDEERDP